MVSWYKKLIIKLELLEEVTIEITRKIYIDAIKPLKTSFKD